MTTVDRTGLTMDAYENNSIFYTLLCGDVALRNVAICFGPHH